MHSILIVDDEPLNIKLVTAFLDELPYIIYAAANSEQAWHLLQGEVNFSVILLDRMLPEIDGLMFAKKIKMDPRFKDIPIIIQTAAAENSQIAEGFTPEVCDYLTKPFDAEILILKIAKALETSSKPHS